MKHISHGWISENLTDSDLESSCPSEIFGKEFNPSQSEQIQIRFKTCFVQFG